MDSALKWEDGAAYEPYVGRWSRRVPAEFVRWLAVSPGSAWLDFGCGTGALSQTILAQAAPRRVIGCDRSSGYADFARRHTTDPRAQFVVSELPELPRIDGSFDACVTGLVLNFLPRPVDAIQALGSRVRRTGTIAAYAVQSSAA